MGLIDKASEFREGEALDENKVAAFLKKNIPDLEEPISIVQFTKGHSNLTYLVTAGDKKMVLRRPPHGTKARSAHDMGREFKILSALKDVYPYCPKPVLYTEDESIIGSPFYLMECITGVIIRNTFPEELNLSEADVAELFKNTLKAQVDLHAVDYKAAGLENFGKPAGYVRRQVEGWSKRYVASMTPESPGAEDVMQWLKENMPEDSGRAAIVHNDFKFDNVILDPDNPFKVIGVLDWEMATLGDPLMDFGASMGYWVQEGDPQELHKWRDVPSNAPGALTREQMVDLYEQMSGYKVENFSFYHCFGVFRLAVIVQQIYYRFFHGQTQDARFEDWDLRTKYLIKLAEMIIKKEG